MLNAFALNSHINKDSKYDDDFFLVMDHAIDQGFAFGHGNGTNHHYGYNVRKIYDAMWLMRDKIAARGKTDEYVKVLAYWSGLAETRKPYVYGRDELLDSWHTLLIPKLISALMLPSEAEQYRAMKGLGVWLSGEPRLHAGHHRRHQARRHDLPPRRLLPRLFDRCVRHDRLLVQGHARDRLPPLRNRRAATSSWR